MCVISQFASSLVSRLTEDGPSRHRFPVQPKGDLRQDHSHEARHVGLNDEVANLPLQVKVSHHHGVLTCGKQQNRRDAAAQRTHILGVSSSEAHVLLKKAIN